MKVTLNEITITQQGRCVEYDYSADKSISKYFTKDRLYVVYDVDVSQVPESILVIPFLANVAPISWFAGFDIELDDVDAVFFESLDNIKAEFTKYYPDISNKSSRLISKKATQNNVKADRSAMLFSGGLDSYATFLRHFDELPDLITIKGADINIEDKIQWEEVLNYNKNTGIISKNQKHYIESNIRNFITFEVDKLLKNFDWWGKIQHGLALTSSTAPIAYINNFKIIYIASTRSEKMPFSPWGSMPETDNLIKWGTTSIKHDGYELTRLDKVVTIIEQSKNIKIKPPLRVCYNEYKTSLNCNKCEKCIRTAFSIMINNQNPNEYGFIVNSNIYNDIFNAIKSGFKTHGTKLYWEEMLDRFSKDKLYIFNDKDEEQSQVKRIKAKFNEVKSQPIGILTTKNIIKLNVINKHPKTFKIYLKIRRKFL